MRGIDMKKLLTANLLLLIFCLVGCGQTRRETPAQNTGEDVAVGGVCDRCGVMFEGMPALDEIKSETTIAGEGEPGERMIISGTVLMKDGKTPARNVILYIYHTNAQGFYAPSANQTFGRMNGHLRGWVKTDENGKFKFFSIRPAPYPNRNIPAHIHILVKETGKTVYYIDEVWFDDDKLITDKLRNEAEKRGGDLIIHLTKNNENVWLGNLTITLGLNIPDYK